MSKLLTLPLAVDTHVHARDMEQSEVMTVMQTFIEAQNSGVGVVCLMPNTSPSIDNPGALHRYLNLIEEAEKVTGVIGYVWVALTDTNHKSVIHMLKHPKVCGVKIYPLGVTTGTTGIRKWESFEKLLSMMRQEGIYKPIAGHWEDPEVIAKEGNSVNAEVTALKKLVELANEYPDFRYTACHLTSAEGLKVIYDAQNYGELDIMIELSPHHLWFCSDEVDVTNGRWKCFPPIKSWADRMALREFLRENKNNPLVCIGSDTAPHPIEKKIGANPPGGLATLQHIIPVILSLREELELDENDIANLITNNAANHLGVEIPVGSSTWELGWITDNRVYNNGKVINPFQGEILNGKMVS